MIRIARSALCVLIFACRLGCTADGKEPAEHPSAESDFESNGDREGNSPKTPDGFDSERLFSNLEKLASDEMRGRNEGTAEAQAARDLIIDQLQSCGVPPLSSHTYEQRVEGSPCINLLAKVEGEDPTLQNRHVFISAHYDHIGFSGDQIYNGAYDNAAAVAAVLETACVLADTPTSRSIVFGFWDCEEPPSFLTEQMGSEFFANSPLIELGTIDVSIVLDLWGSSMWPGFNGLFILGAESSDVVKETVLSLKNEQEEITVNAMSLHLIENQPMGHQSWSDYDGFRNRGVPILFLSDGQNKHYHETTDDMGNIVDGKFLAESKYVLSLVHTFGMNEQTPTWQGHAHLGLHDLDGLIEFSRIALGQTEIPSIFDALSLSQTSVEKIKSDSEALSKITVQSGDEISDSHLRLMRKFTQRLMCLAGSTYPEILCAAL